MELPFSYYKSDSTGRSIRLNPNFAYAFVRNKLDATFSYSQRFAGLNNKWITASFGTTTEDYNQGTGMSTLTNEFYTLFWKENYKKFFRRDFLQLSLSRDLVNGLNLRTTLEYEDNSALTNHSDFTFVDNKNKTFLPNTPLKTRLLSHGNFLITNRLRAGYFLNTPRTTVIAFKTTGKCMPEASTRPSH